MDHILKECLKFKADGVFFIDVFGDKILMDYSIEKLGKSTACPKCNWKMYRIENGKKVVIEDINTEDLGSKIKKLEEKMLKMRCCENCDNSSYAHGLYNECPHMSDCLYGDDRYKNWENNGWKPSGSI